MLLSERVTPWLFFGIAYGISWGFWIWAALLGQDVATLPVVTLFALGGLGPLVGGVLLAYLTNDREGWRDYWRRGIDFRRIGTRWYAVTLLIVPALTACAAMLEVLFGGSPPQPEAAGRFLSEPLAILPYAAVTLLFGPIPEELGWRGYALDRLQERRSALVSSLILGIVWAIWHLPLFFIEGTYQNGIGFGSPSFWLFVAAPIPLSVVMTWIYNNTHRSTLSAILVHFMVNFTGGLFLLSQGARLFQLMLWILAAAAVTMRYGPAKLARQETG